MRPERKSWIGCCGRSCSWILYQIVRHGLRAGVESYSIKRLEPLYGFNRDAALPDANAALALLQASIELDDIPSVSEATRTTVRAYNEDDCRSASDLRGWLETLREQLVQGGTDVPRPLPGDGAPNENVTAWLLRINPLIEKLTADIPADAEERTAEQQARWILANVLDWHRREDKTVWWELFRLSDLSAEDLLDERCGLGGLSFVAEVGGTTRAPIHRYRFPPQETEIRGGEDLRNLGGARLGTVEAISFATATVDIKKRQDSAGIHPEAIFAHSYVDAKVLAEALLRIGTYVAERGLRGDGPYQAARDLLLREIPRTGGQPLHCEGETAVDAAVRICPRVNGWHTANSGQDDPRQPLRAIALHIFRPADDALVGGDLQKRVDPPAGVAMQIFDLDDLHRRILLSCDITFQVPRPAIMRRDPAALNRAAVGGHAPRRQSPPNKDGFAERRDPDRFSSDKVETFRPGRELLDQGRGSWHNSY